MKKGIKRSFALLLTLVMIVGMIPTFAGGQNIFNTLNSKVLRIQGDGDKVKLLSIAYALKDNSKLHSAISTAIDNDATMKSHLDGYGLDSTTMADIMDTIYYEIPTIDGELSTTLIGKIYNGESYADVKGEIEHFVEGELWQFAFPAKLKTEIGKFDKANKGTLNTLEEIINTIVDSKIAQETYDRGTKLYTNRKMTLQSGFVSTLTAKLETMKEDGVTTADSEKLATTFYGMANIILAASEDLLKNNDTENDEYAFAFDLMEKTGSVAITYTGTTDTGDDDDKPSSGGSSGGGSGGSSGGTSTPPADTDTSDLDGDTKEAADDANDVIDSVEGVASEEQQENIQEAVNDVVEKAAENIKTAENAQAVTKALNETTAKAISKLSAPKAVEMAVKQASLVKDALNNKAVTATQAKEMAQDFVKTVVKSTTDVKNVSADQVKQVKAQATAVVKQAVKKASTFNVETKTETNAAGKKTATVAVKSADIKNIITEAQKSVTEMKQMLNENNMSDVAREIKAAITLTVEEEADDVSLDIDADSISQIADAEVDLSVQAKGITFAVPSGLVKAASKLMSVANKEVTSDDNAKLNNKTGNGIARPLKTFDLSVSVDSSTDGTKNAVKIEIPIESLNLGENPNLDNIMIGVFENEAWDKITYKVEDGNIVFTAPHFSIYSVMAYVPSFTDVRDHWANKYIASLSAKDIVSGRDEETFDPQGVITRAEFTKILVNMLGLEKEVKTNFYDVEEGKWYYDAVGIAASYGLSAGAKAGNFNPEEAITREDMATMIARAYEIENGFKLEGDVITFADNNDIADYAVEAVKSMKKAEIISGYEDNTFKPKATATRAEAATMIYKLLQK